MATRATIKIEGINFAKVYKHWDGYPEATLPFLESFNKDFKKNRGDDPEYKFAQLLRRSSSDSELFSLDADKYTGWGVLGYCTEYGEDYEYTLHKDGTVSSKVVN